MSATRSLIMAFVIAAAGYATPAFAADLTLENTVIRATPPGAKVAAGYVTIRNNGTETETLTGVSAEFAGKSEVHEMKMDGGVMKMRMLHDGLEIAPGAEVVLKPGGEHLMFMMLKQPMVTGEKHTIRFLFKDGTEMDAEFEVKEIRN